MSRHLWRALLAWVLSVVVVAISVSAPLSVSASDAGVTMPTGASPDGRIDLSVTATPSSITTPGTPVTWRYTVVNRTTQPAYQVSLTDTSCGPITGGSGLATDGGRSWIPAGGTATYTCTGSVDATGTGTATAVFTTPAADGTRTTSTATASSTVTLTAACSTVWYGSWPPPLTVGGIKTGAIGTLSAAGFDPRFRADRLAQDSGADYILALGVDPVSKDIFYIPSPLISENEPGLYRMKPDGTGNVQVVGPSTATNSERLAVDPDGTVWSWGSNYHLYKLVTGSTTWQDLGRPPGPWPSTSYGTDGDLAFDGAGNLYLLGHTLANGAPSLAIVAAGELTALSSSSPATVIPVIRSGYNVGGLFQGLAFDGDGRLLAAYYPLGATNTVQVINPATGATTDFVKGDVYSAGRMGDLGSCAMPEGELIV